MLWQLPQNVQVSDQPIRHKQICTSRTPVEVKKKREKILSPPPPSLELTICACVRIGFFRHTYIFFFFLLPSLLVFLSTSLRDRFLQEIGLQGKGKFPFLPTHVRIGRGGGWVKKNVSRRIPRIVRCVTARQHANSLTNIYWRGRDAYFHLFTIFKREGMKVELLFN